MASLSLFNNCNFTAIWNISICVHNYIQHISELYIGGSVLWYSFLKDILLLCMSWMIGAVTPVKNEIYTALEK